VLVERLLCTSSTAACAFSSAAYADTVSGACNKGWFSDECDVGECELDDEGTSR